MLTASWVLWMLAGLALLVSVVLPLIGIGDLEADLRAAVGRDFPNETAGTLDRVIATAEAVLIGGGVLLALAEAGFAAAMRSGRGGARIVLVLLLVPVLLHAWLLTGVAPPLTAAVLVIGTVPAVVASILMFLPGAAAWFARHERI